uniref:CAP-Gly domain-containing protein n=1 Tax=Chromera velia CCMP2878 TaxID=1169474 RepID=A0A0G4IFY7_9ALVE|eukprot:Cvel_14046.t1-p1 / transcript=Cvel_14046.t1 / gene=Cvel_14046 / organism=Chromera_velia_CCMP2878 / gene_product=Tubulin-specific chaperone E, putative / transcript_product=Tubulin-specific chaperone E, putative / location=Cvel_scaffold984:50559-58037(-) / protein_length=723 / sequence_SO=supercontig / SO=protein_coding / is_pseudo=false
METDNSLRSSPNAPYLSVGQRVQSADGFKGTIRFLGPVEGQPDEPFWAGVEWDEASRGKHSGTFRGRLYFSCAVEGAGSFVRPSKLDTGISFEEALAEKYTKNSEKKGREHEGSSTERLELLDSLTKKTKEVLFVGKEKAASHFADVSVLGSVDLNGLRVSGLSTAETETGVGFESKGGGRVPGFLSLRSQGSSAVFPLLQRLSLEDCLLSEWKDVFGMIREMPILQSLSLSGNRMRSLSAEETAEERQREGGRLSVKEVVLNRTGMGWDEVCRVCCLLPALVDLHLCRNGYAYTNRDTHPKSSGDGGLSACLPSTVSSVIAAAEESAGLRSVQFLNLGGNPLGSWTQAVALAGGLPSLVGLRLWECDLSGDLPESVLRALEVSGEGGEETGLSAVVSLIKKGALPLPFGKSAGTSAEEGGGERGQREIKVLSVDKNPIATEWGVFGLLSILFPSLSELRAANLVRSSGDAMQMSREEERKTGGEGTGDSADTSTSTSLQQQADQRFLRQLLISLWPLLAKLNGSEVAARERLNSERHVLALSRHSERAQAIQEADRGSGGGLEKQLVAVHGVEFVRQVGEQTDGETGSSDRARGAGSAATGRRRLAELTLCPFAAAAGSRGSVKRSVPLTMRVADLRTVASRLFGIPAVRVRLSLMQEGVPVAECLSEDSRELSFFGVGDGSRLRVEDAEEVNEGKPEEGLGGPLGGGAAVMAVHGDDEEEI